MAIVTGYPYNIMNKSSRKKGITFFKEKSSGLKKILLIFLILNTVYHGNNIIVIILHGKTITKNNILCMVRYI
jgi:succinate dehydrogenase/fumarate reductase cytochrome b subunit